MKSWQNSEFEWEKEIKRDDERILSYFTALPNYLDLPGEEEAIFHSIAEQRELAPVHGNNWVRGADDSDEELSNDSIDEMISLFRSNPGFALLSQLQRSAAEWNAFSVKFFSASSSKDILRICCLYGIVLSRVSNYMQVVENNAPTGLQRSILKRILKELNELSGIFLELDKTHGQESGFFRFASELQVTRERVLRLFFKGTGS